MKLLYRIITYAVYITAKFNFLLMYKLFYRLKVKGAENVPDKGGFIVMSNHASFLDPPLVGVSVWKRNLNYMARSTLFSFPPAGAMLKMWGAFPIKRGTIDREAWAKFVDYVAAGKGVLFFPEGTRTRDGELQRGKPGTGMLVTMAKTKVIPCYCHNTYRAFPRNKKLPRLFVPITVTFGEPLDFSEYFEKECGKQEYQEITDKIMGSISEIKRRFDGGVKK